MATQRQNDIARPCLPNLADAALVEGGGKGTRKQEGVRVCRAHSIRRSTFSLVSTFFRHFHIPRAVEIRNASKAGAYCTSADRSHLRLVFTRKHLT